MTSFSRRSAARGSRGGRSRPRGPGEGGSPIATSTSGGTGGAFAGAGCLDNGAAAGEDDAASSDASSVFPSMGTATDSFDAGEDEDGDEDEAEVSLASLVSSFADREDEEGGTGTRDTLGTSANSASSWTPDEQEESVPTIPTTLHASPSNAQLAGYRPKYEAGPAAGGAEPCLEPYLARRVEVSTRVDVDDALSRYGRMAELLGQDHNPPIITCNASVESGRTMEPVDLAELREVLEREAEDEIGVLYEAIMRDGEDGDGQGGEEDQGGHARAVGAALSHATSRREKVECLLECYASLAGGSTLPSTLEGGSGSRSGSRSGSDDEEESTVAQTEGTLARAEEALRREAAESRVSGLWGGTARRRPFAAAS